MRSMLFFCGSVLFVGCVLTFVFTRPETLQVVESTVSSPPPLLQSSPVVHLPLVPYVEGDESDTLAGDDTAFFVYDVNANGETTGMESNGDRHKVGVIEAVASTYPTLLLLLPQLLDSNGDRDALLVTSGYIPQLQYRYWRVLVESAQTLPSGVVEIHVSANAGADRCGMCLDGAVSEVWRVHGGQLQFQNRTFVKGFSFVGPFSLTGDL